MDETRTTFGAFFKKYRLATGHTLREFCQINGLDPGNLSRLERGRARPPGKRLADYARMLGLEEEGDDWYMLFDLAAAAQGRLPEDLQDDEILEKLPALFRTLRGQRVSDEGLDEVVTLVRSEGRR